MTDNVTARIASDVSEGYDDVARGLARMTRHLGHDARDATSKAAARLQQAAADFAEQTRQQSEALAKRAAEEVRGHPIAAAAIAAVAVGLVGYALTRRLRRE